MSKPIIFDAEAREEFDAAIDYIEEARCGYGDHFEQAIEKQLSLIAAQPKVHAIIDGRVRRAVERKFHYCIYYCEEADHIRIIAIFHTSRDPAEWQRRV